MMMTISFWTLLRKYPVVIPIIQRDYAQGRRGMEYIRKNILLQLGAVLGVLGHENTQKASGNLDFVYGTVETGVFYPLDGQQRLTTLWLLHWYVAMKAGKLQEAEETLKRFSYETRTSSREFCQRLCEFHCATEGVTEQKGIVEVIENQTWFYAMWKRDPTIQAMLVTLGGTDRKDNGQEDFIDGIEELFRNVDCNYEALWKTLTGDNCPLFFSMLEIGGHDLPLSDDLYVKMNARGKQLTDFENFKASLVDWLRQSGKEEKDIVQVTSKIDNDWMDVFWRARGDCTSADGLFFAFVNRFFLSMSILKPADSGESPENQKAWKLYGDRSDDSRLTFTGFDVYGQVLGAYEDPEKKSPLERLADVLNGLTTVPRPLETYLPEWFRKKNETFHVVPVFDSKVSKVTTLTQPQRAVFHAVCAYLATCRFFEDDSFRAWMRVACNLIENPKVETIDSMCACIKMLDELARCLLSLSPENLEPLNVYDHLSKLDVNQLTTGAHGEQLSEEIEKAKLIMEGWGPSLLAAENHPLLHGSISVLLWPDQPSHEVWDDRWQNFQKFLPADMTDEADFQKAGRKLLLFGDYSILDNQNWVLGTSRDRWERLLHNPHKNDPLDKAGRETFGQRFQRILLNRLNGENEQSYTPGQWQYYFISEKYAPCFWANCYCYRWNWGDFYIWKMTTAYLHARHCNPYLEAIAQGDNDTYQFIGASRIGAMRGLSLGHDTELGIGDGYFSVTSPLELAKCEGLERQADGSWRQNFTPNKDIIIQGKDLLKKLEALIQNQDEKNDSFEENHQ